MQTLVDLLPEIQRLGGHEAVRWSNGFRTVVSTYADLYATIGATVSYFDGLGLDKGDRVLIWCENRMEWVAAFWACVARGIVAVPVDFRFSEDLVRRIEQESRPRLIIDQAKLEEISTLPRVAALDVASVSPGDIVEIVYTSGTTGDPKGVVHRHRNIAANLRPFQVEINKYKKWARPFQPVRILDLLPLSHMFGQSMGIYIPLLLEGAAAFTPETHPGRLVQLVREHRISVVVSVPRILENLKNEVERRYLRPLPMGEGSERQRAGEGSRDRPPLPSPGLLTRWWRYRKIHSAFGFKFWAFVAGGAR
ncbi:MAG: AMP-binding protein, partial [Acidobacteria bacterium]|nr:AMP-binding protein [Acidobacteriota bacterium]